MYDSGCETLLPIVYTVHGECECPLAPLSLFASENFHGLRMLKGRRCKLEVESKRAQWRNMAEEGVAVLEFSMVIFVYDGLCGAGVRLSELAFCEFRKGNVKASTKCVCNSELGSL